MLLLLQAANNVRVTGVCDGENTDSVIATHGCAQGDVVTLEVLHQGLGQEGIVLNLRLPAQQTSKKKKIQEEEEKKREGEGGKKVVKSCQGSCRSW